jgi:hypothetical protein
MDGYAVVIHTRDHPPPHVHVLYGGDEEEIVVNLRPIAVREVRGMRPQHIVEAVRIVEEHKIYLLIKWKVIHG